MLQLGTWNERGWVEHVGCNELGKACHLRLKHSATLFFTRCAVPCCQLQGLRQGYESELVRLSCSLHPPLCVSLTSQLGTGTQVSHWCGTLCSQATGGVRIMCMRCMLGYEHMQQSPIKEAAYLAMSICSRAQ